MAHAGDDAWKGRLLGDLEMGRLIGRGAMADVYEASSPRFGLVAVKVLRQSLAKRPDVLERFRREVQAQAKVSHPNVAALLDSGVTPGGEPFLVVELLRGQPLRSVIKSQGPLPAATALQYAWQAAQGLAAVHAQGIWHRDLKPANLMLVPRPGDFERVVLIDFGFATLEGADKLTQAGHVVGSLQYLAPERLRGEAGDHRSDLYSLGITLFEALAGTPPYTADNDFDLVDQQLHANVPELLTRNPHALVDHHVLEVIDRALAKRPEHRYSSASEMVLAIAACLRRHGVKY